MSGFDELLGTTAKMTDSSEDEGLAELLVEKEVPAVRTRYWPAWSSLLVLSYANAFAIFISLNLAFADETGRETLGPIVNQVLFPVGEIAYVLAAYIRGFLNIVIDPAIASFVASIPVFLLALPIWAAQGFTVVALVVLVRHLIAKTRNRRIAAR
jgi:hypothetical protein